MIFKLILISFIIFTGFFCLSSSITAQNIINNPGFEQGSEKTLPPDIDIEKENGAIGNVIISSNMAHLGGRSLLITHSNKKGYIHPNIDAYFLPGNYSFSLWARSDSDIDFLMQIYDARIWNENLPKKDSQFKGGTLTKECSLKKDKWAEFELPFNVTEEFPASIQIGLNTRGKLWLDDIIIIKKDNLQNNSITNGIIIYDTLINFSNSIIPEMIKVKEGWKQLKNKDISGDLCIENNKILIIFRKLYRGAEIYYKTKENKIVKVRNIIPYGEQNDIINNVSSFSIIKNNPLEAELKVNFLTRQGKIISMSYFIKRDEVTVEMQPDEGIQNILIEGISETIVLPDFFSDDIVLYPDDRKERQLSLPDCKFLLQMTGHGEALVMIYCPDDIRDIKVDLYHAKIQEQIFSYFTSLTIPCIKSQKIGISLLSGKGIWYRSQCDTFDIYRDRELEWIVPFQASWRLDLKRADEKYKGLTDSWWAFFKNKGNYQETKNWGRGCNITTQETRNTWDSGLGSFIYPFYIENNSAFFRIPRFSKPLPYTGDILIYPLDTEDGTPRNIFTPVKILEKAWGKEYYDKILNISELKEESPKDKYPATCEVTGKIEKIFINKEETKKKQEILFLLGQMDLFVKNTRERIQDYLNWQKQIEFFFAEEKRTNPEAIKIIEELQDITKEIPVHFNRNKDKIKTPEDEKKLSSRIIKLITDNPVNKTEKVMEICRAVRVIGGTQDGALGHYRGIVKILRQKTGLLFLIETNKETKKTLSRVREQTIDILKIKYGMEGK